MEFTCHGCALCVMEQVARPNTPFLLSPVRLDDMTQITFTCRKRNEPITLWWWGDKREEPRIKEIP